MTSRALFAASALALALAACSGSEPEATETAAADTSAAMAPVAGETPAAEASDTPAAEETPAAAATPTPTPTPTASAKPAPAPAATAAATVAAATPPASFGRCAVCHTADKGGGDKLGPNLFGVYGAPAAKGSFAFSDALKGSGLTLDEATLHKWLENPRALVPGNRMSFPGMKDAAKRQEIIDYLKKQR